MERTFGRIYRNARGYRLFALFHWWLCFVKMALNVAVVAPTLPTEILYMSLNTDRDSLVIGTKSGHAVINLYPLQTRLSAGMVVHLLKILC